MATFEFITCRVLYVHIKKKFEAKTCKTSFRINVVQKHAMPRGFCFLWHRRRIIKSSLLNFKRLHFASEQHRTCERVSHCETSYSTNQTFTWLRSKAVSCKNRSFFSNHQLVFQLVPCRWLYMDKSKLSTSSNATCSSRPSSVFNSKAAKTPIKDFVSSRFSSKQRNNFLVLLLEQDKGRIKVIHWFTLLESHAQVKDKKLYEAVSHRYVEITRNKQIFLPFWRSMFSYSFTSYCTWWCHL